MVQQASERISDAELAIMEILWQQSPLTATDISAQVSARRDWSLATVKSLLSRLVSKQAVGHHLDGRRFLYTPLVERNCYVTTESRRLVDRFFGGKMMPLFAHLAEQEKLTEHEIAEMERLLKEMKS